MTEGATGTVRSQLCRGKRFIVLEVLGWVECLGGIYHGQSDVMYSVLINDPCSKEHEEVWDFPGRELEFDQD